MRIYLFFKKEIFSFQITAEYNFKIKFKEGMKHQVNLILH